MKITKIILFVLVCLSGCTQPKQSREQHRPAYHFSPPKGWMNDPNGLVYHEGEYHLFYQHYPDEIKWGPMHWGHAISTDLVNWQDLPIALYPDSLGYIFSGSAVVDKNNTSGFGDGKNTPLVAIFTYHNMEFEKAGRKDRESQGIAYSLDKGRTWTKYDGNPVIKNKGDVDFRDPKVFWHEATQKWILALAVGDHLELYGSKNLKDWDFLSEFGRTEGSHGGVWECPDFFPLKTKDGKEKWILLQNIGRGSIADEASGTQYFVGDFDGITFKNDNLSAHTMWLDYGPDNYAGVTWFGAPDNRRILIGWMSNWNDYAQTTPTKTWRSCATIPRELSLAETPQGLRLSQLPVKEIEILRENKQQITDLLIESKKVVTEKGSRKEILLQIDRTKTAAKNFEIVLENSKKERMVIGVDFVKNELYTDRTLAGKTDFSSKFPRKYFAPLPQNSTTTLRLLIDVASVEVFANDGVVAMTDLFFPNEDFEQISFVSLEGNTYIRNGFLYDLKPRK